MKRTRTKPVNVSAAAVSNMIDKLSRGVPPYKYLREFAKNGYDAHDRGDSSESDNATITIARDKMFPNKMVIANSTPADPITEEVAEDSLNALFNPKSGPKLNHGIGAKIAYLPQNQLGLHFRCRTAGIKFTIHKDEFNIFGLKTELDDDGMPEQIFECYDEEFTFPDSETEVVLLGKTEDDDTWLSTLKIVNPREDSSHKRFAGWNIRNYFNECFWVSPNKNVDLKIAIYNEQRERTEWARPRFLESIKNSQKPEGGGCNGTIIHPDKTKIHYWALSYERGKKKATHHGGTAGHVGYIYKGEVFVNKGLKDSERRRRMENAGILTHNKNVCIMCEFPDEKNFEALLDRSAAVDENGNRADDLLSFYIDYFREEMPADIKEWMSNLFIDTPTDIVKEVAHLFKKSATLPRVPREPNDGSSDCDSDDNDDSSDPPPRRRRKTGKRKRGRNQPPGFRISDEGVEAPLVSFPLKAYTITVNSTHLLFLQEMEILKKPEVPEDVLKECIAEAIYQNTCVYYTRMLNVHPGDSSSQLDDRIAEDKLDSLIVSVAHIATQRTKKRVEKSIKAQQLKHQAA